MRRLAAFLIALLFAAPAFALTEDETALLKRAESYLNGITTLKSRFVQVNPDGSTAEGDLFISRPGKMRLAYDPPTKMLLVADGKFLIYVDQEMNDTSHKALDDTPVGLLLKANMSFTDPAVKLIGVTKGQGTVEITAAQTKDPSAGRLTFVFSESPFELKQWRGRDAQNKEFRVTLQNLMPGVKIDSKQFTYQAPKEGE